MPSSKTSFSPLKDPGVVKAGGYPGAQREKWGNKAQFILACVGYAVGLGNVWRFPYLCYKSGGGAFLIPYFITLFLTGLPLLLLELGLGQYIRFGPVETFKKITPLLKGTGIATVMITFLLTTYYNVIMTWALFYFFASFQSVLPWTNCNNTWNTPDCWSQEDYATLGNETKPNNTVSASQEYFDNRVLQISGGIDEPNGMRWELFGLLLLAWILVYFCLFKGVSTSGKEMCNADTFSFFQLVKVKDVSFNHPEQISVFMEGENGVAPPSPNLHPSRGCIPIKFPWVIPSKSLRASVDIRQNLQFFFATVIDKKKTHTKKTATCGAGPTCR